MQLLNNHQTQHQPHPDSPYILVVIREKGGWVGKEVKMNAKTTGEWDWHSHTLASKGLVLIQWKSSPLLLPQKLSISFCQEKSSQHLEKMICVNSEIEITRLYFHCRSNKSVIISPSELTQELGRNPVVYSYIINKYMIHSMDCQECFSTWILFHSSPA